MNPFRFDDPVPEEQQIGRESDRRRLIELAVEGRNARLAAPRRFGKTSLVRSALQHAEDEGLTAVYVNFLGVVTVQDVAERIDRAYGSQLEGPLRSAWKAMQATFSAAPGGAGLQVSTTSASPQLLDRLDVPLRIAKKTGARVVVAFDEFQEVARVGEALPGAFRSVIEQHGDNVAYVFCGSQPGMMRELFADQKHAFFAQATPIALGRLNPGDVATAVAQRFHDHDRDPGAALDLIIGVAAGHPQRSMLLAHHVFAATEPGASTTDEHAAAGLATALRHAQDEIRSAWGSFSDTQRRVISVVADGTVPLQGKDAKHRYGVIRGSSTSAAAQRLVDLGHLEADETAPSMHRVVDPFFARWLRDDGS